MENREPTPDLTIHDLGPSYWKHRPGHPDALMYKVSVEICPFQYGQCVKPEWELCSVPTNAPDVAVWYKNALEAHNCPWVGLPLTKKDHHLHQAWMDEDEALAFLRAK